MNWDLSKLYPGFDAPEFAADMGLLRNKIDKVSAQVAALRHGEGEAQALADVVHELQSLAALETRVGHFVFLTLAADANNEAARAWQEKLMLLSIDTEQLNSALATFMGGVEDIDALCAAEPILAEHRYMLVLSKREAAHVIDPALEPTVLRMQMTGGSAWEQLRDQLDANHMIEFEQDGEKKLLPLSAIRGLAYSPDAAVRKAAYEAEIAAYPRMEIPMAACLNGIKGEALTMIGLRHYDTVLDTALDNARVDRETLDAMLSAMRESLPAFRRYFRLKAKLLGYEGGLKFYDLFAPVGEATREYTLEEGRALLQEIMGRFSKKMSDFIGNAFDDHWIDAYPREGKQGGAFCAGVHPLGISYVLSNFDGSLGSVSTLAHELGHAYHNNCMKDESILMADYPMPLAETASIFNETLFVNKLLERADDAEKITLLDQQIGDAAQVIVDILSRFIFESEMIERRKDHACSPRELKEIMLDAQKQTYGDGLDENCLHPYMWACKSHYYSTGLHFYNFPYAFGLLFGLGVFARYLEKGEAFLPEYDQLLRATGFGDVRDVAATVDINVADKNFWKSSLAVIEKQIDTLEALYLHKKDA